ncbi:MAG: hypothetical protein JO219_05425 [Candidatus Eremiobacteraeota bacterium]|nr:hypothetical protein [Candidatus Eremiobacteraeota bacterium]MBV8365374.1 hypothetical protein [Candidatus Eremiobacteraeota bacterium]
MRRGATLEGVTIIARIKGDFDRRTAGANGNGSTDRYKPQVKLSVNVPADQGERLRTLAFEQRVSESSIVQVALRLLFTRGDDEAVGSILKDHGATLRRR